jgi:LPS-assembly lipoprotein
VPHNPTPEEAERMLKQVQHDDFGKRLVRLVVVPFFLALSACGLQPMYAGGGNGAVARGLAAVDVPPIEGKAGWLIRNALVDRLGASGSHGGSARYRLDVRLDDRLEGLGLLSNDSIGRERRTLRARYQLVDVASGDIVLDATAGSDAGIDVVSSEYATIAAENTALENLAKVVADRIVTRLALQLRAAR